MTGVEMNVAGKITKQTHPPIYERGKPPLVEDPAAKKAEKKEEKKEGEKEEEKKEEKVE